jgi:RimJ/RimL family protein N-acetyltransferase
MQTICKSPTDLTKEELDGTIDLIMDYRPTTRIEIRERLLNSRAISLAIIDNKVIVTATLKIPNDIYRDNAFLKAVSEYEYKDFPYELGYMVVSPNFRNLKIASQLVALLCSTFENENVFAITKANNISSIALKLNLGFIQTGKEFKDRKSIDDLKLFIKLRKQ